MGHSFRIRTSDRANFRRCRRKWAFSSHHRMNLEQKLKPAPFWFGSGIHFALEDLHGYQRYSSAAKAFIGYARAQEKVQAPRPDEWKDLLELGVGMMDYYESWLRTRDSLKTYVCKGIPQVEVTFKIPIPLTLLSHLPLEEWGITEVLYTGTFDRVIIDNNDQLWIQDYKTAKTFQQLHFETDNQISAYCWAGNCLYPKPIEGFIYQQHLKSLPNPPRLLANGTYSIDRSQRTTYRAYKDVLDNLYGEYIRAPAKNLKCLEYFASMDTENKDPFIKRDFVYRSRPQQEAEGVKILLELEDMLNPDTPLYPNPTKDCSWDCFGQTACILMDSGDDWQTDLKLETVQRTDEELTWRKHLAPPKRKFQ